MIFVGDVAIAHGDIFTYVGFPESIKTQKLCINLEGSIKPAEKRSPQAVYNTGAWRESFKDFELAAAFLGNNHSVDNHAELQYTCRHLIADGVAGFGTGERETTAGAPIHIFDGACEYVLLGFGWRPIGCKAASKYRGGVNRLEGRRVRAQASIALNSHPKARVVTVFHWNYEFERYPQPAHRKLAHELIDMGVYAVAGHHPHIVGPIERYRGRTIAYSLGNWAFSHGRFLAGRLRFPPASYRQLALELTEAKDIVHYANFKPPSTVSYDSAEKVTSTRLSIAAPFEGLSHEEYLRWFVIHRVKRAGLPIYLEADDSRKNMVKDTVVWARQKVVDLAFEVGRKPAWK